MLIYNYKKETTKTQTKSVKVVKEVDSVGDNRIKSSI